MASHNRHRSDLTAHFEFLLKSRSCIARVFKNIAFTCTDIDISIHTKEYNYYALCWYLKDAKEIILQLVKCNDSEKKNNTQDRNLFSIFVAIFRLTYN